MWPQSKSTGKPAFLGFWGGVGMIGLGNEFEVLGGLCDFQWLILMLRFVVGGVIRGWIWVSTNY